MKLNRKREMHFCEEIKYAYSAAILPEAVVCSIFIAGCCNQSKQRYVCV